MSFNEDNLIEIKEKTSGLFKGKARTAISTSLKELEPKIIAANKLPKEKRKEELIGLVEIATRDRQRAVQMGAMGFSNPRWAAAAVQEDWIHTLISGSKDEIERVEMLIQELMNRD